MNISIFDLLLLSACLIEINGIGILAGIRKKATNWEYFLHGRSLGWFMIGGALLASNISAIHLVGLAAAGASVGLVMRNFECIEILRGHSVLGAHSKTRI